MTEQLAHGRIDSMKQLRGRTSMLRARGNQVRTGRASSRTDDPCNQLKVGSADCSRGHASFLDFVPYQI